MKLNSKVLYVLAGVFIIIGGKLMILADIWFPHVVKMTPAQLWSSVGETVFAVGVFALVVALVHRVFFDKTDI